jgi:GT2 family glycosyltransferase
MATTSVDRSPSADDVRSPSVLAVLITRDAVGWLRESLQALASQTYPRLGVLAIDNGSTDGTREVLQQALGEGRVIGLEHDRGLAGALNVATELPPSQAADYLLLLDDGVALEPDAVARLVESAQGIRGVERVGVVGPKIVDWDDPRVLREVGRSTDRFGHPYTPLQEGERDQGQYDRVLEVLFVSSDAMLISREAWQRTGSFDERFSGRHDDLDFCWRARLAGFRVLMTPLATARRRAPAPTPAGADDHRHRSSRYYAERAALASMLKDYGVLTLLWLLPLYAVIGLARLVSLALSRRFEDAYDLLASWGWNLLHLPGTVRRRVRAQSVRAVRDRSIRRFMAPTFRFSRWFERAEQFLGQGLEELEDEELGRPLPRRAASLATGHPVLLGIVAAVGLGALAIRHFIGPETLSGGALAAFPAQVGTFFNEFGSSVRTTVLGGGQPASPALAGLGAGSWLAVGTTSIAQKVFLAALPALAAIASYRGLVRQTASPGAAVVASGAYLLSAVMLWAFSQGRIELLVGLAILPMAWDRFDRAFARRGPERSVRFAVGLGIAIAAGLWFLPAIVLPLGLFAAANLIAGRRRDRGLALAALAAVAAALLAMPVLRAAVGVPSAAIGSVIGVDDPWMVLRLAPGSAPGTWLIAAFLPIAALLCFAGVGAEQRGRAWRAMLVAISGTGLAWASAAGYLPASATNAPAYLAAAAVAEAALVAYGLSTFASGLGRQAFGARQLGAAVLTTILAIGIGAQALQVALAEWAVGPDGLPPAWPVVASSPPGEFRIVWLGRPDGGPFPAPGGDPIGLLEAGDATVKFGITDRDGATALDEGRGRSGAGYDTLRSALEELVAGDTQHAGALLGPFGVRFVIANEGDLPAEAAERLALQVDLDRVPAGGLVIYRNAAALPTAFVSADAEIPVRPDLATIERAPQIEAVPLEPEGSGWRGQAPDAGVVAVTDQYDEGWRVDTGGREAVPERGWGWAISAPVSAGSVSVVHTQTWVRTIELIGLCLVWIVALWITRRPASA